MSEGWEVLSWLALAALLFGGVYLLATSVRRIPTGHVGLVYRKFGRTDSNDFKVRVGPRAQGFHAVTLSADSIHLRSPFIYNVTYVTQVYVPPNTIGVVVALVGAHPLPDHTLCRHVECDLFQDGRGFLLNGGQMGRQAAILPGGAYYDINPRIFEVITVDTIGSGRYGLTEASLQEIAVPVGATGVVIVLEGESAEEDYNVVAPVILGHSCFQLPWVFLQNGGRRGAQAETLGEGIYRINPWFARVVLIPTRDLILEWTKRSDKSENSLDVALDQIRINVEGHWLRFDMTQTIRIPTRAAPRLVRRFGEQEIGASHPSLAPISNRAPVQRFVERVLGRTVEGYFHEAAAEHNVLDFMRKHDEVRLQLEGRISEALAESDIEAVRTTLNEFESETLDLDQLRKDIATEREKIQILEYAHEQAKVERKTEQIRNEAERERRKLEVAALEEKLRILGPNVVATQIFLRELAKIKVPNVVAGNASALLDQLPLHAALDMIDKALLSEAGSGQGALVQRRPTVLPTPVEQHCLTPVYILLDESSTVWMDDLNAGMTSLCTALIGAPPIARAVRISVLGYADDVAERLALQEVRAGVAPPHLTARGTARLGMAFTWLLDHLPGDVQQLKDQGFRVRRPQVLILTGSEPADGTNWRRSHRQLLDREQTRFAPDIVACGIGQATACTILEIATRPELAFIATSHQRDVAVLRFCEFVRACVFAFGQAVLDENRDIHIRCPAGFQLAREHDDRKG